jgi:hypothetical protein
MRVKGANKWGEGRREWEMEWGRRKEDLDGEGGGMG